MKAFDGVDGVSVRMRGGVYMVTMTPAALAKIVFDRPEAQDRYPDPRERWRRAYGLARQRARSEAA